MHNRSGGNPADRQGELDYGSTSLPVNDGLFMAAVRGFEDCVSDKFHCGRCPVAAPCLKLFDGLSDRHSDRKLKPTELDSYVARFDAILSQ